MYDSFFNELLSIARQAVEYTKEYADKPNFVEMAERFFVVAKASQVAKEKGSEQGWDLFDVGSGYWSVQSDDDQDKITDGEAIVLAKLAGLRVDEVGNLIDKNGKPIVCEVGA